MHISTYIERAIAEHDEENSIDEEEKRRENHRQTS